MSSDRIPIGIPPGTSLLRVERYPTGWRLWIHNDPSFTYGTYLLLADDGSVSRIVERADGVEEVTIKPKES